MKAAVILLMVAVTSLQGVVFHFSNGNTLEGDIIEFRGTNTVVLSNPKFAKTFTVNISALKEADRNLLVEMRRDFRPPIIGAFGIRFGEVFRAQSASKAYDGGDGRFVRYAFRPTEPLQGFGEYSVGVTPKSNRVYAIHAAALGDPQTFYSLRSKLVATLEDKYGKAVHTDDSDLPGLQYDTITVGMREVMIVYSRGSPTAPVQLAINYTDKELEKQGEDESGNRQRDEFKKKL
jgi:hypothetical protein